MATPVPAGPRHCGQFPVAGVSVVWECAGVNVENPAVKNVAQRVNEAMICDEQ